MLAPMMRTADGGAPPRALTIPPSPSFSPSERALIQQNPELAALQQRAAALRARMASMPSAETSCKH